jgi:hypothetical protein
MLMTVLGTAFVVAVISSDVGSSPTTQRARICG